ncbi:MBL fold metallo-hydrolase [Streptomyces sp. A244]|uniref:MBL fold metallo-hydrolase n=1 Tax=Streptomyces sp. A244 TaxID=2137016 RepID=UPI00215970F6|nr:MBL fold metallo-hydrolase [Streptomyces sp. A244]
MPQRKNHDHHDKQDHNDRQGHHDRQDHGCHLTGDANFVRRGQYAYLGHGLLTRRLTEPSLDVHELPRLDAVALSHLHGDHGDRRARRHPDHTVPILTTPHAARRLRTVHGFHRTGLRTWKALTLQRDGAEVTVTALPARPVGGPG